MLVATLGKDAAYSGIKSASTTPSTAQPAATLSNVRVYNISVQAGAASPIADQLRANGFHVSDVSNPLLPNVAVTTVYFSNAPGEHETADAIGKLLGAPVEPRIADVADQPPGVIVVVPG